MFYEKNIATLKQFYPHLYETLKDIPTQNLTIHNSRTNNPTLSIKNKNKEIFLHSKYDPKKEAQRQLSSQQLNPGNKVILFGCGLGYLIPEILSAILPKGNLIIIEPNYAVFKMALKLIDFRSFLSSPNIVFIVSDKLEIISHNLCQILKNSSSDTKVIIHQPTLEIIPASLANIEELLKNIILSRKSSKVFASTLAKNLNLNIKYIIKSIGIKNLFNKYLNLPIFVISAGPSLDNCTNYLSRIQEYAILISVGTALSPLLNNKITPDFVVITDCQEFVFNQFSNHLNKKIPLIFIPTAYPKVIEQYQGTKIIALIKDEFFSKNLVDLRQLKGEIETGGSVATASLDIAIRMGGNPIIFIGQDLSYPSQKTHAQDTYQAEQNLNNLNKFNTLEMIYRENLNRGNLIEVTSACKETNITHRNLLIYLRWIENRIRKEKNKTFINTSTIGAKIKGTLDLDLREINNHYCQKKINKSIKLPSPIINSTQYNKWKDALQEYIRENL
ncbi:MAG: DUF115 domain-containing protein [bacterium]|nr:DUF115 domain-containing protein [bacterium]